MWTSTIKRIVETWREVDPTATDERFYKRTERKGGCTGGKTSNCWMEMIQQRTGLFNHKRVNRKEAVKCSTGWSHHLTPPWWFTWWLSPYQNWTDFVCMENVLYGFKTAPGWGLMMVVLSHCLFDHPRLPDWIAHLALALLVFILSTLHNVKLKMGWRRFQDLISRLSSLYDAPQI